MQGRGEYERDLFLRFGGFKSANDVLNMQVMMTIVDGRIVFNRN